MESLGQGLTIPGSAFMHHLVARSQENAPPNTYGGNYGFGTLPLHTDLAHWYISPRYLVLRCLAGSSSVATLLLDGFDVVSAIGQTAMRRALVQPRRPVAGQRALLHLLEQDRQTGRLMLRWDELFLVPASPSSAEVFSVVKERLTAIDPKRIVLHDPGDTLVLDNWRMLHGRSPTVMSDARVLQRAYLGELA